MSIPEPTRLCLLAPLFLIGLLASGCASPAETEAPARPPNIVLILSDDLGYGDLGSYNPDSKIPTPHMDQLAAEGLLATQAHAPAAVCTPTRYGLLTGRYAWRTALKKSVLLGYSPSLIDTSRLTLPALLREAGYATAGVGKWHLGLGDRERTDYAEPLRPGPASVGFDYFYGIPSSLDFPPYLYFENDRATALPTDRTEDTMPCCVGAFWRGGAMAPGFRHADVLPTITEKAVSYIERRGEESPGQPFFLYVAFASPHTPWLPSEEYRGRSGAGEYGDFTTQTDAGVGLIMQALDRAGFRDNTLVIATSDNGAYWTPREIAQYGHRANHDLRGMKADIYEGGHRVPFVARWPGKIAAGSTSDEIISLVDVMATVAAITGTDLPEHAAEDSYNLLPVLLGETRDEPVREATVLHSTHGMFAIRQGPWKFIEGLGSGGFTEPVFQDPLPGEAPGQLYNLATDPGETTNLYEEHPDVVERLSGLLDRYRQQGHSRPLRTR